MKTYKAEPFGLAKYLLGESPFYDPRTKCRSFVDIIAGKLYIIEAGGLMKQAAGIIAELTSEQIQSILDGTKLTIDVAGTSVELDQEKVIVDRFEKDDLKVLNDGTLTVGLDSKITDELKKEGYVRDLIRGIQNQRKENGYNVTDRIILTLGGDDELKSAYEMFADFIANETLAQKINWESALSGSYEVEADDKKWSMKIEKA